MVSKVNITFDPSLVNEHFCLINGRLKDSLVIPDEGPNDRLRYGKVSILSRAKPGVVGVVCRTPRGEGRAGESWHRISGTPRTPWSPRYSNAHTRTHIHTHTFTHTHTHKHTQTHTQIQTYTNTDKYIHNHTHAHTFTLTRSQTHNTRKSYSAL